MATLNIVLLIELALLAWAWSRSGFMPYPHAFLIYIIGAQVCLWANATGLIRYEFIESYTTGAFETQFKSVVLLFFAIFLGAVACTPAAHVSLRGILNRFELTADTERIVLLLIVALYGRMLLHFYYIDWGVAWSSETYLEMSSPKEGSGALASLLMASRRPAGLVAMILATFLACNRRWAPFVFVLPLAAWHILFEMAAHSRTAMLLFATAGLTVMMLRPHRKGVVAVLFSIAFVALFASLSGRTTGHHGFSSLPSYVSNIEGGDIGNLSNIFEGVFVTAEVFGRPFDFNETYKLLSLSPLLSFIDGFEAIRVQHEQRLTAYVPTSAVIEVLSFGWVYASIFFAVQFAGGWLSARALAHERSLPALALNALMLLGSYLQFTYSTRTVFRFFLAAAVVSAVLLYRGYLRRALPEAEPIGEKPDVRRRLRATVPAKVSVWGEARARRLARALGEGVAPRRAVAAEAELNPARERRRQRAAAV